jgi:hypothetical protein
MNGLSNQVLPWGAKIVNKSLKKHTFPESDKNLP